jgi:hypothetical protein
VLGRNQDQLCRRYSLLPLLHNYLPNKASVKEASCSLANE